MRELTDHEYEIADRITEYVDDDKRKERTFTASELARIAGCATWEARSILAQMRIRHWIATTRSPDHYWCRYYSRRSFRYYGGDYRTD